MRRRDITVLCVLIALFCLSTVSFLRDERDVKKDVAMFISQFNDGYIDDAQIAQEVVTYTQTKFDGGTNTISAMITLDFTSVIWKSYTHYVHDVVMNERALRLFLKDPTLQLSDYEDYFFIGIISIILVLCTLFGAYMLYTKYARVHEAPFGSKTTK